MRKVLIPLFAVWFVLVAAFPALASPLKIGPFLIYGPCDSDAPDKTVEVKFDSNGVGSVPREMEVPSPERVADAVYEIVSHFRLLEFLPETKIYIFTNKAGSPDAAGLYYPGQMKIALLPQGNWEWSLIFGMVNHYLTHEIGHLVCDLYFSESDFQKYRQIRDIPGNWQEAGEWGKRPGEVFAEDFRYIFEPNVFKVPNRTALELTPEKEAMVKDYILEVMTKKIAQARDSR